MANMSYCRFENTLKDFSDCVGALEEALDEGMGLDKFKAGLSSYELSAFRRLSEEVSNFIQLYEAMVSNDSEEA